MDLLLKRSSFESEGIFGVLSSVDQSCIVASTLEHAFPDGQDFKPIITIGSYTCVRGMHRLAHMAEPFETFEITGVVSHTKVLLHAGNTNKDSEGCVLLGKSRVGDMITQSRVAFDSFMQLQRGVDSFTLTVE